MSIQKTVDGKAKKIIARLQPKNVVKNPNVNDPHIAPMFVTDPTQDTSDDDNGPEIRGVFSDKSFGRAGENQPMMAPWPNIIKLAKTKENANVLRKSTD